MQTIHILRHFKVKNTTTKKLDSQEFGEWVEQYDKNPLEYLDMDLPKVDTIYVSTQNRARKTADHLKLDYETTELLKEVEASPFMDTAYKLPKNLWLVIGRIFWFFNMAKSENKKDTIKRVDEFIEKIQNEESVLIVSHGLFIKVLIHRLKKLGYKGEIDFRAKNGKLYKFTLQA
jgi:broad specificity phosphatase PhoE